MDARPLNVTWTPSGKTPAAICPWCHERLTSGAITVVVGLLYCRECTGKLPELCAAQAVEIADMPNARNLTYSSGLIAWTPRDPELLPPAPL
jgi:hypothetical protein